MKMADAANEKSKVSLMALRSSTAIKSQVNLKASLSRLRFRRQSFGFSGIQGIKPPERTSQLAIEFKRPPLMYLPTYQLEPRKPIDLEQVTKIVEETINEHFTGHKYHLQGSSLLAIEVAGNLRRKVKGLCLERYRLISVVTIGQKRAQCYNNAVAFNWDHMRDSYVDAHRETATAFIQVTLFNVYLD